MTANRLQNFVNGRFADASGHDTHEVINPATEQVVALQPTSNSADVDAAMAAAAEAFEGWRRATPSLRQKSLLGLADALEAGSDTLVEAQHRNTGQIRSFIATEEVAVGADQVRFFAGAARRLDGVAGGEYLDGYTSYVRREPIGVIAQITPWNYPLMMAIWKMAPAIAAGNTVVLKPASTTPESTLVLAELTAGVLPDGVFNVLVGDRTTGALMVDHSTTAMAAITGSVRAGIEVAKTASNKVKRVHLELGGKAPAVVFADADLAATAPALTDGGYFNAGQDCTAVTRVLVQDSVHDEFVAALVTAAREKVTGDAENPDAFYGPLNSAGHLAKVSQYVDSVPGHITVATGGHRVGERGFYYAPTVLTGVRQDDAVVQEEIFGPVLTVQPFRNADEALALANGVPFGLASSVWTSDHQTALRFSRELNFGCVWINTHIPLTAEMPHGGFGYSGYGKDLSVYGLDDYTRVKHVMSAL
ncbi:MAG TPA: aminobutyraldehyde dehydrogenase [Dermatophilaceae bacterium]|nr:aminobutyraldehyde dehydrogenase [Dermatophilaceae bacterium]